MKHATATGNFQGKKTTPTSLNAACRLALLIILIAIALSAIRPSACRAEPGMKPEHVYRPHVPWKLLVDTWETLPPVDPLGEKPYLRSSIGRRILLTLRKDGTCRVFNGDYPKGVDGIWTYENHSMQIRLPRGSVLRYYVYGIKGDYMMTRSAKTGAGDQLWSRVK